MPGWAQKNKLMDNNAYIEANRELWNQRTMVHRDSAFYDRAGFLAGKPVLTPIETAELGEVRGKTMLHLQCHFGMDSLDWARRGAKVTGMDLSENAIREAEALNREMGLDARFICCNLYDLEKHLEGEFDIVFTSYGVIGWLPDLDAWARIIAKYLRRGGIFYMAEFHPVAWMFDEDFTQVKYFYDNRELIVTESTGTYTDREAPISGKEYSWNHSLSEVLNALLGQGLRLQMFNEHMYSPYPCFQNIVEIAPGQWSPRGMEGKLPMVYSLKAERA